MNFSQIYYSETPSIHRYSYTYYYYYQNCYSQNLQLLVVLLPVTLFAFLQIYGLSFLLLCLYIFSFVSSFFFFFACLTLLPFDMIRIFCFFFVFYIEANKKKRKIPNLNIIQLSIFKECLQRTKEKKRKGKKNVIQKIEKDRKISEGSEIVKYVTRKSINCCILRKNSYSSKYGVFYDVK